jgi:hypothetical protein
MPERDSHGLALNAPPPSVRCRKPRLRISFRASDQLRRSNLVTPN